MSSKSQAIEEELWFSSVHRRWHRKYCFSKHGGLPQFNYTVSIH